MTSTDKPNNTVHAAIINQALELCTNARIHPLPFIPLHFNIYSTSPFSFPNFGKLQTSRWMFRAVGPHQCSAADYSIPHYFNTHWTFQSHITGLPNNTHTINTCTYNQTLGLLTHTLHITCLSCIVAHILLHMHKCIHAHVQTML